MRDLWTLATALGVAMTLESAAWAGVPPPAAPGPVIAAGIPAMIGLSYLYKRMRDKR